MQNIGNAWKLRGQQLKTILYIIYIYIYIYLVCVCIYIYIYRERERERWLYQKPHGSHKPKMYNRYTYKIQQSKHNIKDGYQITREEKKRREKKRPTKTDSKQSTKWH